MSAKQPRTKKPKKHLIYTNFEINCYEGCEGQGDCNCWYNALEDERMNLETRANGRILVIADLGLWNGRRTGYKILTPMISDILYSDSDYVEWYSDGRNIKAKMAHHDGTNYMEYRVIRENRNIDNLLNKLYNQEEVTRQMINYYTESLHPYINKIYGWR